MKHARRAFAFTIIELLVIIAIITMLLSIAAPSLQRSKIVAREAQCGSNMRQATISFTSFSNDNGHFYPDFSQDPKTKAQWSNPNYWTQGYWRKHMLSYGLIREMIYSPSNPVWNRDDFYHYGAPGNEGTEMVMGYFYFGSTLVNTSSYRSTLTVPIPAGTATVFPRRNGGVSHYNLMWADLNRQQTYHLGTWLSPDDNRRWGSNHWYGRPDQKVDGSHRAFADNHVEWVTEPTFRLQSTYSVHMYW